MMNKAVLIVLLALNTTLHSAEPPKKENQTWGDTWNSFRYSFPEVDETWESIRSTLAYIGLVRAQEVKPAATIKNERRH